MNGWGWVLAAALVAVATKLVGYLLPDSWLEHPRVQAVSNALTVGLLAALVMLNTFESHGHLHLDARLVALGAAVVALLFRAPFLVVVIVGAVAAAVCRALGMP